MDYIKVYFRDNKELPYKEWLKLLNKDINEESKHYNWDIASAIRCDLSNGRDKEINGHIYKDRSPILYDSANELLKDAYGYGLSDKIYDMLLEELSEEQSFNILSKLQCVEVKDGKLLLKDERDW